MSLKRIAVRTKKSLSGLRGGFGNDHPSPPETPKKQTSPSSGLDEFGMLPYSPNKDSGSKRNRLMGSWRRMMANFDSSKPKGFEEQVAQPVTPLDHTPSVKRPSLALNFEVSPADKPMFSSSNSSAFEIPRSSPIAVYVTPGYKVPAGEAEVLPRPGVSKPSTPPHETELPMGTIPDTPAPLHRESVQNAILSRSRESTAEPVEYAVEPEPLLTPMPGTNLTLDDIQPPAIVISSPKVPMNKDQGYFAIPLSKNDSREARAIKVANSGFLGPQHGRSRTEPLPSDEFPSNFDFDKTVIVSNEMFNDDLDAEARKSLEGKHDFTAAYLALDGEEVPTDDALDIPDQNQADPGRRRSTWSRNTGLYDGTGYATPGLVDDIVEDKDSTIRIVADESAKDAEYDADSESAVPPSAIPLPSPVEEASIEEAPVDEKEALHEIIQAYAFAPSMIGDDDKEHAIEDALEDIKAKQEAGGKENIISNAQRNARFYEPAMRVPMDYDDFAQEAIEESDQSI